MTNLQKPRAGQKRLLLLGGNRYNVPSIRSAKRAGFFVYVADPHPNAAGLAEADTPLEVDVLNYEQLAGAVRQRGGVDGIVSMSEVGVEAAARLGAELGIPAIPEEAAARCRSKAAMRRAWAHTDFSTEFAVVESETDACRAASALGFPLIVKPDRSFGGSRGVSRVDSPEGVSEAFRFAISAGLPGTAVVVERCISGAEHSCEVLLYGGECSVLCIGQKVKSQRPYRVDMSVQYPAPLSPAQEALVERMCHEATAALGLTRGVAHVEFAVTSRGPVLYELGARCGGSHSPQAALASSGVEEFVEVCRMACGDPPVQFRPLYRRGADYRFVIFPPGRVAAVELPEDVLRHPDIIDAGVLAQPGDEIHPVHTTSDRSGFVVTRGEDRNAAVALADWACSRIRIRYTDGSISSALPIESFETTAVR